MIRLQGGATGGSNAAAHTESPTSVEANDETQRTRVLLDSPVHQNHAMYTALLNVVHERDRELGRTPDELSKQLAGGLTRICSAKFSEDGRIVGMTDTANASAEWAMTAVGNVSELVGKPWPRAAKARPN